MGEAATGRVRTKTQQRTKEVDIFCRHPRATLEPSSWRGGGGGLTLFVLHFFHGVARSARDGTSRQRGTELAVVVSGHGASAKPASLPLECGSLMRCHPLLPPSSVYISTSSSSFVDYTLPLCHCGLKPDFMVFHSVLFWEGLLIVFYISLLTG